MNVFLMPVFCVCFLTPSTNNTCFDSLALFKKEEKKKKKIPLLLLKPSPTWKDFFCLKEGTIKWESVVCIDSVTSKKTTLSMCPIFFLSFLCTSTHVTLGGTQRWLCGVGGLGKQPVLVLCTKVAPAPGVCLSVLCLHIGGRIKSVHCVWRRKITIYDEYLINWIALDGALDVSWVD